MGRRLSLLLLLLYWAQASAKPPTPLLWQVSDEDNSIYLLGSFHMLKAEDYPLADPVNKAFDEADKVYFEVPPDELNDGARVQSLMKTGMIAGGETLEQSLRPKTWHRLQSYCEANGLPLDTFQTMKPWLAALTIASLETVKAGYLPDLGLDKHYMEMAAIAHKETAGLESLSQQFNVFDRMEPKEQELFLNQTLKDMQNPRQLHELHQHWRNGDADGLMQLLRQDTVNEIPEFYRRLNSERNRAWLPQIAAFLKENREGSALVVVGSLHLLGDEGLIELLRRQGFRTVRVQ
ncbi:TraB/GumN family protein [Methylomicrobium sp. RS1]|uniref:TraB/GumN family protein n=1 Tax=Candidatus Methylomicrobium oryzae TaxID=2802053 RepID=UPI00192052A6|nr:TraB/GumN family protein [Methylomicrobium sp. RS1]MBL1264564.1 TraB/GumN family protein [Methylomicrobium sp. RS1]